MARENEIELVNHLRTVHFTLTAICFTLFLASLLPTSNDLRKALGDIRNIIEATHRWDHDWLSQSAAVLVERVVAREGILPKSIEIPALTTERSFAVHNDAPLWGLAGEDVPLRTPARSSQGRLMGFDTRLSLSDFKTYWDKLSEKKAIYIPRRVTNLVLIRQWAVEEWHEAKWVEKGEKGTQGQLDELSFRCGERSNSVLGGKWNSEKAFSTKCALHGSLSGVVDKFAWGQAVFPIAQESVEEIHFPAQLALMEHLRNKNVQLDWRSGPFSYSFSELDSITKNYQDLAMEQIELVLRGESERSQENLEIVGIRLPTSALRTWGSLVILMVQIYFMLHLSEFQRAVRPRSEAWGFAWIALYPGRLPSLLFVLSACVLPAGIVLTFALELLMSRRDPWLVRFGLWPSLALASAIFAVQSARLMFDAKKSKEGT